MTPEELDEATVKEAKRLAKNTNTDAVYHAARLAREGWTPPEPVDPDILAFREWVNRHGLYDHNVVEADTNAGKYDSRCEAQAFLAGARMGREQERERANHPVAFAVRVVAGVFTDLDHAKAKAREALAKYRGEA